MKCRLWMDALLGVSQLCGPFDLTPGSVVLPRRTSAWLRPRPLRALLRNWLSKTALAPWRGPDVRQKIYGTNVHGLATWRRRPWHAPLPRSPPVRPVLLEVEPQQPAPW